MTKHPQLVSTRDEAIQNIHRFNGALPRRLSLLQNVIRYAQSWYVVEDADGYHFGPSKYIGYKGMEPHIYAKEYDTTMDGRLTDRQLKQWATPVDIGTEDYEAIRRQLADFCQKYGLTLNQRARISMLSQSSELHAEIKEADRVKALKILIDDLSEDGKRALRRVVWGD